MAIFDIAYGITNKNEGGYANVSGDTGGITYGGITKKWYPNWVGWKIVESKPRENKEVIPEVAHLKKEFYKLEFWDRLQGDKIQDQELANQLYDEAVNSGLPAGIRMAMAVVGMKGKTASRVNDTLLLKINSGHSRDVNIQDNSNLV